MEIMLPNSESQEILKRTIDEARNEFKGSHFEIDVKSKKLAPIDILIDLTVQVSAFLLYDVIKRVTARLSESRISVKLSFESRQTLAESLLLRNGIREFKLNRRLDAEDMSTYAFVAKNGTLHDIVVHSNGACDYKSEPKE